MPGSIHCSLPVHVMIWRAKNGQQESICLWYDGSALDAAQFYAETRPAKSVHVIFPSAWLKKLLAVDDHVSDREE